MDIDFNYLQKLLRESNALRDAVQYRNITENDYDTVTYIANKNDTRIAVQDGLRKQLTCQEHGFREKETLRKSSKFYCKIYRKEGRTICVESHVKGRIDVVFLAQYTENRRYLFPFSAAGGYYPTYTYVTHFSGGTVDEEYSADSTQIVYERYRFKDDTAAYEYINYVPNGTAPVLSRASGFFTLTPVLQYHTADYSTWRDDETLNPDKGEQL